MLAAGRELGGDSGDSGDSKDDGWRGGGEHTGGGGAVQTAHRMPSSRMPWASRLAAASQYRSSISTPIALRPRLRAATRVDPDPANGSATIPGGHAEMRISITSTGLACGWP